MPDKELSRLDFPAAVERALWDVYHAGGKDAKAFMSSNRRILAVKEEIIKHHEAILSTSQREAYDKGRKAELLTLGSALITNEDQYRSYYKDRITNLTDSKIGAPEMDIAIDDIQDTAIGKLNLIVKEK